MKKTLLIVSAIALSVSVFAAGNPDKAAACSKDAVVKDAPVKEAAVKKAAEKKVSCGGCPLSK